MHEVGIKRIAPYAGLRHMQDCAICMWWALKGLHHMHVVGFKRIVPYACGGH